MRVVWHEDSAWYCAGIPELMGTPWLLIVRLGRLEIGVRRG